MKNLTITKKSWVHGIQLLFLASLPIFLALDGILLVIHSPQLIFPISGISIVAGIVISMGAYLVYKSYLYLFYGGYWSLLITPERITYKVPNASKSKPFDLYFKDIYSISAFASSSPESSEVSYQLLLLCKNGQSYRIDSTSIGFYFRVSKIVEFFSKVDIPVVLKTGLIPSINSLNKLKELSCV